MNLLNPRYLLIGSAILVLTGCGAGTTVSELKDKAPDVGAISEKVDQVKNIATHLGPLTDNISSMKTGVSQTLTAVKSGDFATAQGEFTKLQTSWKEIEGDVKNISSANHQTIQSKIDTVSTQLQASNPDTTNITKELEGLTGSLGTLAIGGGDADLNADANSSKDTSTSSSPDTNADASKNSIGSNLSAMQDSLAETKSALESADIAAAKTSFSDARQSWFKFGGSVKQTSAQTYQTIDGGVKTMNQSLNSAAPAPEKLLADLGSLSTSLKDVTPN